MTNIETQESSATAIEKAAMTYKQAKYAAASDRRDGLNAYAVFNVPRREWIVKRIA